MQPVLDSLESTLTDSKLNLKDYGTFAYQSRYIVKKLFSTDGEKLRFRKQNFNTHYD